VAHPAGPLHVVAACLEWEPEYAHDRIAQARAIVELATDPIRDGRTPTRDSVRGLERRAASPVLKPLRDTMIDTWTAAGGDSTAATLRSDHPQAPLEATELIDQRIDHIFIRLGEPGAKVTVESVALLGDPVDGIYPSDHQAVVCTLNWTS
jgi:endonuclease/exonuclease/phosphatase family metal-dependent hydrolase